MARAKLPPCRLANERRCRVPTRRGAGASHARSGVFLSTTRARLLLSPLDEDRRAAVACRSVRRISNAVDARAAPHTRGARTTRHSHPRGTLTATATTRLPRISASRSVHLPAPPDLFATLCVYTHGRSPRVCRARIHPQHEDRTRRTYGTTVPAWFAGTYLFLEA